VITLKRIQTFCRKIAKSWPFRIQAIAIFNRIQIKQTVTAALAGFREGREMKFAKTIINSSEARSSRAKTSTTSWLVAALIIGCSLTGCSLTAFAQTPVDEKNTPAPSPTREEPSPAFSPDPLRLTSLPRNLFLDQKNFWTTPFHMTKTEWRWTVPLAFVGAGLLASDTAVERHVPTSSTTVSHAVTASNAGLAVLTGAGAGMFLLGQAAHNDQRRETGLLSGEAGIDALLETTVFKYAMGRDRPFTGGGRGRFFQGGDSFPSDHATVSWAIASVIAHEYNGPLTQLLVYGVAGGVSAARVAGHKHFASDVVVGSALGWYTGRQVFRSHSRYSAADIAKFGTFSKGEEADTAREPRNMGSSYVPVDSWVYPAFDRLIASGFIHDRTVSIRPWTRLECTRILSEVHQHLDEDLESTDAHLLSLIGDLDAEFRPETQLRNGDTPNVNAELESVYTRYTGISGPPLRDSFHFAQTIADDFGRPYGRGANDITGFSTHAAAGPFVIYVRGEYQYGSSSQQYTPAQAQDLASTDGLPVNSVPTFGRSSRLRTVEAYAGLNLADWQFTFGQQSLWWGANRSTSLLLSNNAEAIPMLRVERTSPTKLPSLLSLLGPMSVSGFLGRLGGDRYLRLGPDFVLYGDGIHNVDPQPYIWGANIAFKPTSNLELGFSFTAVFAGHGRPLTLRTFLHSLSQHGNNQPLEPGDRRPAMTASYRLPGLRNSVVLYADAMTEDQPLPLAYPRQSALNAGMYLPHLPRIKNLDLRCEGVYTNLPGNPRNNFYYTNAHYADGYRNYDQLIGSWVGRGGNGGQASTTYWFSGRNQATLTYRRLVSDQSLIKGGNVHDASASLTWMLRPQIEVAASLQYERWNFGELNPGPRSNLATTIEIRVWPKLRAAAVPSAAPGLGTHP
jgi:membrane-associated phospholipid phosphatase